MAANSGVPLNEEQILTQWKQMWECIEKFDESIVRNKTDFIAGNTPSIADFLYFYELTNLAYFKVGHEKYKGVSEWYKKVSSIP